MDCWYCSVRTIKFFSKVFRIFARISSKDCLISEELNDVKGTGSWDSCGTGELY